MWVSSSDMLLSESMVMTMPQEFNDVCVKKSVKIVVPSTQHY
jgi:hypothetical protein